MRGTRGWYSIALVFTVEFYVLSFVVFEQSTNYCSWPSSQPCNHSLALLFLFFFLLFYQSLLYDHSAQSIGSVNGGSNEAVHSFLLPSQTLWIQATASSLVHWPLVFHWGCCAAFITDHIINYNTLPMQGADWYNLVQVKQHQALAEHAFASIGLWSACVCSTLVTIIKVSGFDFQWSAVAVTEFASTFQLQLDLPINFRFVFGWHDLFGCHTFATHTSEHQQHQLERWCSSDQLALLQ